MTFLLPTFKNSTTVLLSQCFVTHIRAKFSLQALTMRARFVGMRVFSFAMPQAALRVALARFITPPRFDYSAQERKLMSAATPYNVHTPYGRIAAWRIAATNADKTAPVVMLTHGWGGRGAQLRSFVEPLLAAGYQVIFFDHLGHGSSDGRQAALVDFWRGVEAVWDHEVDSGNRVEGMIAHSLGSAGVASAIRRSLTRKHIEAANPRVVLIVPPSSLVRYSQLFARYLGITERIRRAMQWRFEQRYGVAWEEFELPHSVCKNNAPALFIHDSDDRETGIQGGLALAQTWPDARFMQTKGLGHRRILRDKAVMAAAVDFIANRSEFAQPPTVVFDPSVRTAGSAAPLY